MDPTVASSIIGGVSMGTIFSLGFAVYKLINHTACRSRCCKKVMYASIDIGSTPVVDGRPLLSNESSLSIKIPE